ncbi:hypothetical protein HAX54_023133, partial [Datura stramonium]|nr:hypothetical protein [Datura stramonium]
YLRDYCVYNFQSYIPVHIFCINAPSPGDLYNRAVDTDRGSDSQLQQELLFSRDVSQWHQILEAEKKKLQSRDKIFFRICKGVKKTLKNFSSHYRMPRFPRKTLSSSPSSMGLRMRNLVSPSNGSNEASN